jgi:hypothetical protein
MQPGDVGDVAGDHVPHNVGDHKGKGTSNVVLWKLVSGLGFDVLEPGLEVGSRVIGEGVGKGDCLGPRVAVADGRRQGRGRDRGRGRRRGSYTPTGGVQAAWSEVRIPDEMPIYFDVVNIHMGYAATRENHIILERCMQRLYPKWEHGINKPLRSTCDSSRRVRAIDDLNVKESLQLLLKWYDFGRHIWEQVRPVSMEYCENP